MAILDFWTEQYRYSKSKSEITL